MKTDTLNLICCPECGSTLSVKIPAIRLNGYEKYLLCSKCGIVFSVEEGMPGLLIKDEVQQFSRRMEFMRSTYARYYDFLTRLMFVPCGGDDSARHEVLDRLNIPENALILETGIGTGDNLPHIVKRVRTCRFFGIDNQQIMLEKCRKKLNQHHISAELLLANAEKLPFRDHVFDVVFHLGAINIFNDKKRAIMEMIRVAKEGSKIVIADESEKAGRLFNIFIGKQPEIRPPIDLIPPAMLDVRLDTIWNGYGYVIEFRTPPASR